MSPSRPSANKWVRQLSSPTLLRHGLYWLTISIVADYATSWAMMSLLGPQSEGSLATRTLFETRTLGSLVNLLANQYAWIIIFTLALSAYLLSKAGLPKGNNLQYLGVALSWLYGAARLMVGPSSNFSAILLSYGTAASDLGYFVVFVGLGVLVIIDFYWTLTRR